MQKLNFWIIFSEYYFAYLCIFTAVASVLYLSIRPLLISVYHILFLYYYCAYIFILTAVIFLYKLNYISIELLIYTIITQIVFVCGLYVTKFYYRRHKKIIYRSDDVFIDYSYYVSASIFLVFTIITYSFFGFPILEPSRWELYQSIPGAGIIGRFIETSKSIIVFALTYKYTTCNSKFKIFDKLVVFFLILSAFMAGSKIAFFEMMIYSYVAYCYIKYHAIVVRKVQVSTKLLLIIMVGICASLFVTYINQLYVNNIKSNAFLLILDRLVMTADLQIMSFPDNLIVNLQPSINSVFEAIFFDFKTLFQIVGINFNGRSLGLDVMYHHHPDLDGVVKIGPASTFETFYIYYFGAYWGVFLSFVSGVVLGALIFNFRPIQYMRYELLKYIILINMMLIIFNPQVALGKAFFSLIYFIIILITYHIFKTISVRDNLLCE